MLPETRQFSPKVFDFKFSYNVTENLCIAKPMVFLMHSSYL